MYSGICLPRCQSARCAVHTTLVSLAISNSTMHVYHLFSFRLCYENMSTNNMRTGHTHLAVRSWYPCSQEDKSSRIDRRWGMCWVYHHLDTGQFECHSLVYKSKFLKKFVFMLKGCFEVVIQPSSRGQIVSTDQTLMLVVAALRVPLKTSDLSSF